MAMHKISDEAIDAAAELDMNKVFVKLDTEDEMTIIMRHKLNGAQLEIFMAGYKMGFEEAMGKLLDGIEE